MKLAAIILDKWIKEEELDALKVGDIHDEWQFDCLPAHADRVGKLACAAMTKAGEILKMKIKIEGEYSVGRTWAETH
jgi:DNA polymerase I-like protein with 3'-5' exonuclease and polymerase domains